ncbi:hypothetical protein Trydic_g22560 [Trypoxylus dichotomus]
MNSSRIWHDRGSTFCRMIAGQTRRRFPLVFVQLTKSDESKKVFRITRVCGIPKTSFQIRDEGPNHTVPPMTAPDRRVQPPKTAKVATPKPAEKAPESMETDTP